MNTEMEAFNHSLSMLGGDKDAFIIADGDLNAIYISPAAYRPESCIIGTCITDYIGETDAFRLEEFTKSRERYDSISSIELPSVKFADFNFAYAVRRTVFGVPCIQIYLFPSKRDFLLSDEKHEIYTRATSDTSGLISDIRQVKKELETDFGVSRENAFHLSAKLDSLYTELIRSSLIRSVTKGSEEYPSFDICAAVDLALKNSSADGEGTGFASPCVFSASLIADKCRRVRISAENLICLVSASYSTACAVSDSVRAYADMSADGVLSFSVAFENPELCPLLPDGAGLIELDSLLRGQSFRLFLCDLICTEFGYTVRISSDGNSVTVTFDIPPINGKSEFKSRDMLDIPPDFLSMCADAVRAGSSDTE